MKNAFPEFEGDWSDVSKKHTVFVKYRDRKLGYSHALSQAVREPPKRYQAHGGVKQSETANSGTKQMKPPTDSLGLSRRRQEGDGSTTATTTTTLFMEDAYLASNLCLLDDAPPTSSAAAAQQRTIVVPPPLVAVDAATKSDGEADAVPPAPALSDDAGKRTSHLSAVAAVTTTDLGAPASPPPLPSLEDFLSSLRKNDDTLGTSMKVVSASFEEFRSLDQEAQSLFAGSCTGTTPETPFLFDSVDELLIFLQRRLDESKQAHAVTSIAKKVLEGGLKGLHRGKTPIWVKDSSPVWEEVIRFNFYSLDLPSSQWIRRRIPFVKLFGAISEWRCQPAVSQASTSAGAPVGQMMQQSPFSTSLHARPRELRRRYLKVEEGRSLVLLTLLDYWVQRQIENKNGHIGSLLSSASEDLCQDEDSLLQYRAPVALVNSFFRSLVWICEASTLGAASNYGRDFRGTPLKEFLLRDVPPPPVFLEGFPRVNDLVDVVTKVGSTGELLRRKRALLRAVVSNAHADALFMYVEHLFEPQDIISLVLELHSNSFYHDSRNGWCFSVAILKVLSLFNGDSLEFDVPPGHSRGEKENEKFNLADFLLKNSGECRFSESYKGEVLKYLTRSRGATLDVDDCFHQVCNLLEKKDSASLKSLWRNVNSTLPEPLIELLTQAQREELWKLASVSVETSKLLFELFGNRALDLHVDTPVAIPKGPRGFSGRLSYAFETVSPTVLEWRLLSAGVDPNEQVLLVNQGTEGGSEGHNVKGGDAPMTTTTTTTTTGGSSSDSSIGSTTLTRTFLEKQSLSVLETEGKHRSGDLLRCYILLAAGASAPVGLLTKLIAAPYPSAELDSLILTLVMIHARSLCADSEMMAKLTQFALESLDEELLDKLLGFGASIPPFDSVQKQVAKFTYKDFKPIGQLLLAYGGCSGEASGESQPVTKNQLKAAVKGLPKNKAEFLEKFVNPSSRQIDITRLKNRVPPSHSWRVQKRDRKLPRTGRPSFADAYRLSTDLYIEDYELVAVQVPTANSSAEDASSAPTTTRQKRGREDEE